MHSGRVKDLRVVAACAHECVYVCVSLLPPVTNITVLKTVLYKNVVCWLVPQQLTLHETGTHIAGNV